MLENFVPLTLFKSGGNRIGEKMKFVRFDQLPEPWQLTDEWLDRLEIKNRIQRNYRNLSEIELMKLGADFKLFLHYQERNLLRPNKTLSGFIGDTANYLDKKLLVSSKGRAVDFKKILVVFEKYTQYLNWTKKFSKGGIEILNIILPYWVDEGPNYKNLGPGFLEIKAEVHNPTLGKLGQVKWGVINIHFSELDIIKWWQEDEKVNPFDLLYTDSLGYTMTRNFVQPEPVGQPNSRYGLLDFIANILHRLMKDKQLFGKDYDFFESDQHPVHYPSKIASSTRIQFSNPRLEQVQEIFDYIALYCFKSRFPRGGYQLQFDVEEDLSVINVATVFNEINQRGGYLLRKNPLN